MPGAESWIKEIEKHLHFRSLGDAAKDFAKTINGISIENDWEFATYFYSEAIEEIKGGWIFTWTKTGTTYSYTEPHTDKSNIRVSLHTDLTGKLLPPIPKMAELEAIGHTHGAWKESAVDEMGKDRNDRFSPDDEQVAIMNNCFEIDVSCDY